MIYRLIILVGKTAYEVSKEGYSKHMSQQWTWFTGWINGKNDNYTKATEIKTYSPLKYGLYYSAVGEDVEKNDMFENITYYKVQFEEEEKRQQELAEEEARKQQEAAANELAQSNNTQSNNKNTLKLILAGIFVIMVIVKKKCTNKKGE